MMEIFWNYILGNSGGCRRFFDGGKLWHNATASHYGFKGTVPGAELSIPAAQTFLDRSKGSYRKCRAGGWGCSTHAGASASAWWVSATASK